MSGTEIGRLAGKGAVVTGSSSGIGRAIAELFAAEGAHVVVNYRTSRAAAEEVVASIREAGGRALALQADVADAEQVREFAGTAAERLDSVDVWCNIAGADILTGHGAGLSDREKLELLLSVDVRGTILCSWAAAEIMRPAGGGVILNMGWDHVASGMEGRNPELFAAAKGGVLGFSRSLARSLAPEIRVNVLAPGWIETSFARDEMSEDAYREVVRRTPLRRWGRPEDVARAALYLASEEADFVTGQTLMVNGGLVG